MAKKKSEDSPDVEPETEQPEAQPEAAPEPAECLKYTGHTEQ